jgi:pyruvate/oxaloacetate carboxyltransferase
MVQYELFISMVFQNFVSMFINFDSMNLWRNFEMLICIKSD